MIKIIVTFTSFAFLHLLSAQTQGIAYTAVGKGAATTFVTDYHSLGINSSALGWKNEFGKKFTLGTSEFGFGIYSDALSVDKLRSLYGAIRTNASGGQNSQATRQEQQQFAKDFAGSNIVINANYNWFGASMQFEKFGGIAFSISENYQWDSKIGQTTSDLLFNGKYANAFDSLTIVYGNDTTQISNRPNIAPDTLSQVIAGTFNNPVSISSLTAGTRIKAQWTRAYNFGFGRKLFGSDSTFALYAGIGGRYIQAIAMFDVESDGSTISMSSAMSPSFDINYSPGAANASSFNGSSQGGFPPKSVGSGYGLDFSLSAKLFGKLTVAAAVNNIGKITYTRNVYSVRDTSISRISIEGLNTNNITQATNSFLQNGGILNLQGEERASVSNPATLRLGASMKLLKIINVGFDVVTPFDKDAPGSIANPIFAFGGEIRPVKWLALSAGYFGSGIYKNNIPMGINFILGKGTYEVGISSRDILSFFLNDSNSVSMALGFARFRF
jgi:hypothetical protein